MILNRRALSRTHKKQGYLRYFSSLKLFLFLNSDPTLQKLSIMSAALKHRQVKHYGFEFRYGTNDVDVNNPLETPVPDEFHVLFDRLKEQGLIEKDMGYPEQLTVNQYLPGQGNTTSFSIWTR